MIRGVALARQDALICSSSNAYHCLIGSIEFGLTQGQVDRRLTARSRSVRVTAPRKSERAAYGRLPGLGMSRDEIKGPVWRGRLQSAGSMSARGRRAPAAKAVDDFRGIRNDAIVQREGKRPVRCSVEGARNRRLREVLDLAPRICLLS